MKMARLDITYALLKALLQLPEDFDIVGVADSSYNTLQLYVESKDFPDVEYEEGLPFITGSASLTYSIGGKKYVRDGHARVGKNATGPTE